MTRLLISRNSIQAWLFVSIQLLGVLGLAYGVLVDRFRNPAIIPTATGLVMFPKVYGDGSRE
jgi:hypothetical protein